MARMVGLAVAALVVLAVGVESAEIPSAPYPVNTTFFTHLDSTGMQTLGQDSLPFALYPYNVTGNQPEQVNMRYISDSEITLTYITGQANFATGDTTMPAPPAVASIVRISTTPGGSTSATATKFEGTTNQYTQVYYPSTNYTTMGGAGYGSFPTALNYTSGLIHYVTLRDLKPSTEYYYTIGDPADPTSLSTEVPFKTMPAVGAAETMTFGVFGDLGDTANSSTVRDHLLAANPDFILNTGDFTYADDKSPTPLSQSDIPSTRVTSSGGPAATNQPRWDFWGRFMQSLISQRPMAHVAGNHEIESDGNEHIFQSWTARYGDANPYRQSGSSHPQYYSFDVGLVHIVALCNYLPFGPGSDQFSWFQYDMENSLNRALTPWVIVMFHAPLYNTVSAHYKENECMRQIYEPMFNQYGVDILLHGHVHSYERTNPVIQYAADPTGCAPTYITIGDGGNLEKLYNTYVDEVVPGSNVTYCPGTGPSNNVDPGTVAAYQVPPLGNPSPFQKSSAGYCNASSAMPGFGVPSNDPFCYTTQPGWSSYREGSFGHAILTIDGSGNNATWEWHRADDNGFTVSDSATFVRDIVACPNRAYGAVPAVARVTTPSAAPPPPTNTAPTPRPTAVEPTPTPSPTKPTAKPHAKPTAKPHPAPPTCTTKLVKTCAPCTKSAKYKVCCYTHHVKSCTPTKG